MLKANPKIEILSRICDTTKPDDVKKLAEAVQDKFHGRLDVVIANAGVISKYLHDEDPATGAKTNRRLPVGIVEDDYFGRVIDINLMGSYYVAKYFTPILTAEANKSLVRAYVVITSIAAHLTQSNFVPTAYNLTKIGVVRMVEHMHNDHSKGLDGGGGRGLVAYAVHPGAVVTPQTQLHSTQKGDAWEQRKFS